MKDNKAVIYARFSSNKQTEQSIEGQIKVCEEYAERNGYTIIGKYIDRAFTGKNDRRPGFQKMIKDSKTKAFQTILVYSIDRFSRNALQSLLYEKDFAKLGLSIISATETFADGASGTLQKNIMTSMAQYYVDELSQKTVRGMRINAEKGLSNGGIIPFGYKSVDKQLEIDEEKAPFVRKIFQMYADGSRIVDIVNYLNDCGVKTAKGGEFRISSLHNMLKNKKYIGVYKYDDIVIENKIPRIISDELFNEVAEILEKNKQYAGRNKAKDEYILTSKLFCGECKSKMVGTSGSSHTGKVYKYYICSKTKTKKCNKKSVNKEFIEDLVVNKCLDLLSTKNINKIAREVAKINKQENDNNTNLRELNKKLRENQKASSTLIDSLEYCTDKEIMEDIYERLSQLKNLQHNIENEIALEKKKGIILQAKDIKFFLMQLKKGAITDVKYKKKLINIFVNSVYVYNDKIILIFNVNSFSLNKKDVPIDEIEKDIKDVIFLDTIEYGSPKKTYHFW